jgi:hypothetical protein
MRGEDDNDYTHPEKPIYTKTDLKLTVREETTRHLRALAMKAKERDMIDYIAQLMFVHTGDEWPDGYETKDDIKNWLRQSVVEELFK